MRNNWNIELVFEEDGNHTACTATLGGQGAPQLKGHGYSRRAPADEPDPQIGESIAASRACSNLSHELLEQAASVIEAHTNMPTHLIG
ncbi:MAG: hypothetical protein QOI83_156 [Streptomycetaceae bacterium]|jgi:hypothetical protein|nr:hypothetical protein [Streptomycetaceae bacterium]